MTPHMPTYEAFAIRYASVERRAVDTFLHWGKPDEPIRLDFFFWVVRGDDGRCIVVDTGFSPYSSSRRNRPYGIRPADALAMLQIDPEAVSDVILTHLHYDHAGNTDLFPNATFHLQESELAFVVGPHMRHAAFREHYEVEDLASVIRLLHRGRVRLHQGDSIVAPGIELFHMPGHTLGLQSVGVETPRGRVLIAGDTLHYYENLRLQKPFPVMIDVAAELDAYQRLLRLAASEDHIVAGHDPLVLDRFRPVPMTQGSIVGLHLP